MKTLHCDYFVPKSKMTPDGQFWGAISITNHSNEKQICVLTVIEYDSGKVISTNTLPLNPFQSFLLDNSSDVLKDIMGRTRLYLDCSEFVTATVGNSKGKISSISWERMAELPFPKQITPSRKPTCLGDDYLPFYRYCGKPYCCFLREDLLDILTEVIKSIIIDRPTTKPFILGDATPLKLRESCPGHPTHRDHQEIDIDYPLYSGNGTQFDKENLEIIWESDKLIEDKIDWWALHQFIIRLDKKLNSKISQFIIYKDIFDFVIEKSGIKKFSTEYTEFYGALSIDELKIYRHQTHAHLNLRE